MKIPIPPQPQRGALQIIVHHPGLCQARCVGSANRTGEGCTGVPGDLKHNTCITCTTRTHLICARARVLGACGAITDEDVGGNLRAFLFIMFLFLEGGGDPGALWLKSQFQWQFMFNPCFRDVSRQISIEGPASSSSLLTRYLPGCPDLLPTPGTRRGSRQDPNTFTPLPSL